MEESPCQFCGALMNSLLMRQHMRTVHPEEVVRWTWLFVKQKHFPGSRWVPGRTWDTWVGKDCWGHDGSQIREKKKRKATWRVKRKQHGRWRGWYWKGCQRRCDRVPALQENFTKRKLTTSFAGNSFTGFISSFIHIFIFIRIDKSLSTNITTNIETAVLSKLIHIQSCRCSDPVHR